LLFPVIAADRIGIILSSAAGWDSSLLRTSKRAAWAKRGALTATLTIAALLLSGCDAVLLDPKGPIGEAERNVIYLAIGLMLIVVVPVIVMVLVFAWKYRASNTKATYAPEWSHSNAIEAVVWTIPVIIILVLGTVTWIATHTLDPRQPIASAEKPLEVQVVSLDWKWLFIYPEYGVASVNELVLPAGRPVHFFLTSSGVMNAFFIPQLGSQIYTMAGMQTQLYLKADHVGSYMGLSANYSGHGFADMHFKAEALDPAALKVWVAKAKHAAPLDTAAYRTLAKPGTQAVTRYGSVESGLFDRILNQRALGGVCDTDAMNMSPTSATMPMGTACDPKSQKKN
jgi:cytochrome o ubiquinol oxidase subunit 2